MHKVLTVGELIEELKKYPPTLPIFTYDADEEQDAPLQTVELAGPVFEVDDGGDIRPEAPYYCKGISYIDEYWKNHGYCPVLCLRNYFWEE